MENLILVVKEALLQELELMQAAQASFVEAIEPSPGVDVKRDSGRRNQNPVRSFLEVTDQHKALRKRVTLLSLANGLEDATPPIILGLAVDTVTRGSKSFLASMGLRTVMSRIFTLAGISVGAWMLSAFIEYRNDRAKAELANAVRHDLRVKLYNHIQTLDMSTIESRDVGKWLAVLENDVNQVHGFIRNGMTPFFNVATNLISVAGIFLFISPAFAAVQLLMLPPLIYASKALLKPIRASYVDARDDGERMTVMLSDNLNGMSTINSFHTHDIESMRVAETSLKFKKSITRAERTEAIYVPSLRAIAGAGFITSIIWGGIRVGNGTLSSGALNTMSLTQLRLLSAIARLGYGLEMYQKTASALDRIQTTLETKPTVIDGAGLISEKAAHGDIVFKNVDFGYDPRCLVLKKLNLSFPAGKMIGIVGATGAGKSTLVKLLLRFYDPQAGEITLDKVNLKNYPLKTLRESMAFVSQNVTLFAGSIRDNIAYGRHDAGMDEIVRAAKIAEAHDFIMKLPLQYETDLGFGGISLSGGQRQRLAIARAILLERPILLFDEATSALDFETEASLQRSLQKATADRTTIVIAHRLSTIRNADIIYVLRDGELCESGTHEELIATDQTYAGMWKIQTGEKIKAKKAIRNKATRNIDTV